MVEALRPTSEYLTAVAPATVIWVKVTLSVERSIFMPVWVVEVLVQDRLIWLLPAAVPARLVGAVGGGDGACVVALAVLEYAESPAAFVARAR